MRKLIRIGVRGKSAFVITWAVARCDTRSDSQSDDEIYYGASGPPKRALRGKASEVTEVPGTAVTRAQFVSESHDTLRQWATATNWREATRRHKAAFFNRFENLEQEALVEKIREHYHAFTHDALSHPRPALVQAGLFRCDAAAFEALCASTRVCGTPEVVAGVYDEKRETCIVDFANKQLGGAWLSYGMVQEEKMFIERPDIGALCARALVDMRETELFPPTGGKPRQHCDFSMGRNEAWVFRGAPAYASLNAYGRIKPGWQEKLTLLDPADDRYTSPTVVAIDAIKASPARATGTGGFERYERRHLEMMVLKAYTGFAAARHDSTLGGHEVVASGHWGCGVRMAALKHLCHRCGILAGMYSCTLSQLLVRAQHRFYRDEACWAVVLPRRLSATTRR